MNRLFISTYLMALPVVIGVGAWRLAAGDPAGLAWLGPMVSAFVPLLFVGGLMIVQRARTAEQPIVVHLAGPIGVGAAALLAPLDAARVPLIVAGVLWVAHLFYLFGYSRFGRERSARIEVGAPMPQVIFSTVDGEPVSTADLRGAPAVLLFFRGNWCPLCMAQIREVAARYREVAERGAKVVLISPQSEKHTRNLAAKHDVPFEYWIDHDLSAAKELEIIAPNGVPLGMELLGYDSDTVLPTVVVLDAEGIVRMADQTDNYRVRPEPETFLAVLDGV